MSSPSRSASARSLKRLSLNLPTGPRPLHLVDPKTPTAPLFSPPSSSRATSAFRTNPRRQSSISYLPQDRTSDGDSTVRPPLKSPEYSTARSNSALVGPRRSSPLPSPRDRRSRALEANQPTLTHAEKHSELLHFIAQKESTCLELRSQLAMHEAELLELKRRWERIISRGFETSNPDGLSIQGQGSGAVLEGIREGVQGVSRFLAAGLAISELSSPSTTSTLPGPRRTHSVSLSISLRSSITRL